MRECACKCPLKSWGGKKRERERDRERGGMRAIECRTMQRRESLHVAGGSDRFRGTAVSSRQVHWPVHRARASLVCHALCTSGIGVFVESYPRFPGRTKCIINYYDRSDSVIGRRLIARGRILAVRLLLLIATRSFGVEARRGETTRFNFALLLLTVDEFPSTIIRETSAIMRDASRSIRCDTLPI